MALLILEDLKKHFAAQEVLQGTSLDIDPGSKVGIVGRNGGGNTTLSRMITGEESPDWGRVRLRKGTNLGFLPQRPVFGKGVTVLEYVETGLDRARALTAELQAVGERMADDVRAAFDGSVEVARDGQRFELPIRGPIV